MPRHAILGLLICLAAPLAAQETAQDSDTSDESATEEAAPETESEAETDAGDTVSDSTCFSRQLLVTRAHYTQPAAPQVAWEDIYLLDMAEPPDRQALRLTRGALDPSPYDNAPAAWTADGARIVFRTTRGAGANAAFFGMAPEDADGDGLGDELLYLGPDDPELGGPVIGAGGEAVFSMTGPQGQIQVFAGQVGDGATELSEITRLTDGQGLRRDPAIAGNGAHLLYTRTAFSPDGPDRAGIALLSREAGTEVWLTPEDRAERDPAALPGSDDIVFVRDAGDGAPDLWRATLDTAEPALSDAAPLTETPELAERRPTPSPDGACLAWLAADTTLQGPPDTDLYIRDMAREETRRVTKTRDITGIAWRP